MYIYIYIYTYKYTYIYIYIYIYMIKETSFFPFSTVRMPDIAYF